MSRFYLKKECCNPIRVTSHKPNASDLRQVQPWMQDMFPNIQLQSYICSACRKRIKEIQQTPQEFRATNESTTEESQSTTSTESVPMDTGIFIDKAAALNFFNEFLRHIGVEVIDNRRTKERNYIHRTLIETFKSIAEKLFEIDIDNEVNHPAYIQSLKEKYGQTDNREVKCTILSLIPKEWSLRQIINEFPGTSLYMARNSKFIQNTSYERNQNLNQRRSLDEDLKRLVQDFYKNDDVSRIMPGKKDCVSIRIEGRKKLVQKRLILNNLKEVYSYFKQCYPEKKIGLSKFATLRPKNCVLAGSPGTHSVCVCTIHQNVKLMIDGSKISKFTLDDDNQISTYKCCIAIALCKPPNSSCYLGSCSSCPKYSKLRRIFTKAMEKHFIDTVKFYQWTQTDRSNLEMIIQPLDDFIDSLVRGLSKLIPHTFITENQNNYFKQLKINIESDEFLVVMDFSENYNFIIQNAAQGFHWRKDQATVHPFGVYFKNNDGEIIHTNLIVISDCMMHDTIAVHLFQKYLISFLKLKCGEIKKIHYFSDGSAAQYKNRKQFFNISSHYEEYQIAAEWNFFATSHGKNVCDGLGGTLKRLAAKASLQKIDGESIKTPLELYQWAKANIKNMNFQYVGNNEYINEKSQLSDHYLNSKMFKSTRKVHHVQAISKGKVQLKYYSTSSESFTHNLMQ